jgi:hypothetical protein
MGELKYVEIKNWGGDEWAGLLHYGDRSALRISKGSLEYVTMMAELAEKIIDDIVQDKCQGLYKTVGYYVYYSLDPDLPKEQWVRMNRIPLPTPEFIDTRPEPGVRYYYFVRSVNGFGIEGEPSEVVALEPMPNEPSDKMM